MKTLIKVISFITILIIVNSCVKDHETFPTYNDQGNIGSEGGIIKTNDGASVQIPRGALPTSKIISITNTTEDDTIVNTGCGVYELKPDGLTFSDSVIITLPFDDKFLDLNSKEENYGIGIRTLIGSSWVNLKVKVNLKDKTASIKSPHFSKYIVDYPNDLGNYFRKNKSNPAKTFFVPSYYQGSSNWCAYYSLSMVARSSGIYDKGPFFASLMGEGTYDGWLFSALSLGQDIFFLTSRLDAAGIKNEYVSPNWGNIENLCGYILKRLDTGYPVWICSFNIHHSFVITGHTKDGFYVNDPSGYFLIKAFETDPWPEANLGAILVSYDQFMNVIKGTTSTLVITSGKYDTNASVSINFPPGYSNIKILNSDGNEIGNLEINGKYSPTGYALINKNSNSNAFNGTDFITIFPILSNTESTSKTGTLHCIIDHTDRVDPFAVNIPSQNTIFNDFGALKFQFSNLLKWNHILTIELRSDNASNVIYDYWDFPFTIATEFFPSTGTLTDNRDNHSYKWVRINNQTWMAENLAYLPEVTPSSSGSTTIPYYYVYSYQGTSIISAKAADNFLTYGVLYNWPAAQDACPTGWHLPNDSEWHTLALTLDANSTLQIGTGIESNIAGGKLKEVGTTHWSSPNTGATNEYGFTALPGGNRDTGGTFIGVGSMGLWWGSTEQSPYYPWYRGLFYRGNSLERAGSYKSDGFSVRCIKD